MCVYNVAEVLYLRCEECTFRHFREQLMCTQYVEHDLDMVNVFVFCFRVYEDVIHVHTHKITEVVLQNVVHKTLKRGRRVCEAKRGSTYP
jgi:hypothetical protein